MIERMTMVFFAADTADCQPFSARARNGTAFLPSTAVAAVRKASRYFGSTRDLPIQKSCTEACR